MNSNRTFSYSGTNTDASSAILTVNDDEEKSKEVEVHVIGELEAGYGFNKSGGLFCEVSFQAGSHWVPLTRSAEITEQTQSSYASAGDEYIWNHPIDLHYGVSSLIGWPRCRICIYELTNFDNVETVAYGTLALPSSPGHHELICRTWAPLGSFSENLASRLLGEAPLLKDLNVVDLNVGERVKLSTISSGTVFFSIDVITRNFEYHDINVQNDTTIKSIFHEGSFRT